MEKNKRRNPRSYLISNTKWPLTSAVILSRTSVVALRFARRSTPMLSHNKRWGWRLVGVGGGQSGSAERQHTMGIRREGQRLLMWLLDSCSGAPGGVWAFCKMLISVTEAAPLCALSFSHVWSGNQGIIPELSSTWLAYRCWSFLGCCFFFRIVIFNDWPSRKLCGKETGR